MQIKRLESLAALAGALRWPARSDDRYVQSGRRQPDFRTLDDPVSTRARVSPSSFRLIDPLSLELVHSSTSRERRVLRNGEKKRSQPPPLVTLMFKQLQLQTIGNGG